VSVRIPFGYRMRGCPRSTLTTCPTHRSPSRLPARPSEAVVLDVVYLAAIVGLMAVVALVAKGVERL
jgi:hypothetical protein